MALRAFLKIKFTQLVSALYLKDREGFDFTNCLVVDRTPVMIRLSIDYFFM